MFEGRVEDAAMVLVGGREQSYFAHVLFGKPVATFPGHALALALVALLLSAAPSSIRPKPAFPTKPLTIVVP